MSTQQAVSNFLYSSLDENVEFKCERFDKENVAPCCIKDNYRLNLQTPMDDKLA